MKQTEMWKRECVSLSASHRFDHIGMQGADKVKHIITSKHNLSQKHREGLLRRQGQ